MAWKLALPRPLCAARVTLALLAAAASPIRAQAPCPRGAEAARALQAGWTAFRADSVVAADRLFARADSLCPGWADSRLGLGFTALRTGRLDRADSLFRLVADAAPEYADAWSGLALVARRRGRSAEAVKAAKRALALPGEHPEAQRIYRDLAEQWDRPPLGPHRRPDRLRLPARTRGRQFEVADGDGWRSFYIRGVNLGVALPGRFPAEFPGDSATYAGWLTTLGAMHANTIRLYTILPPQFYRALRGYNLTHPEAPLWLIHGVWTELPPHHDFDNSAWLGTFHDEMRRVVDLIHGQAELAARPGHASGRYDANVSPWTLAYIIGREWEPFAVIAYDSTHPGDSAYRGRLLEAERAPAMERWMAQQCDYLLGYELDRFNTLRPIAFTNWPTLDPLTHPTESGGAEERAWRRRMGRPGESPRREYENDAIGVDASLIHATSDNPAGWFASYHAYPYYPDFMLYDPGYSQARSPEGASNYFGYLQQLVQHHGDMPVVIAEYGVPSSRGLAHWQPQGWSHGGHDEAAMAAIDARLTRDIRASGAAGGVIFAWLDEWFKHNWVVIDFELPAEHNARWLNRMDAEQQYGILGLYPGDSGASPVLGGASDRWRALTTVSDDKQLSLHVGQDEANVYLTIAGLDRIGFSWSGQELLLAIDTYLPDRGQHLLPGGVPSEIGFEFLARFRDTSDAQLTIVPEYNPYLPAAALRAGDDLGRFYRRPATIVDRFDGRFDSLFTIVNRTRFGRDGTFFPARGYNRGRLQFGTEQSSSLADWYYDQAAGLLELRLPWGLLQVTDPSTGTVLYEQGRPPETARFGTARTDGFRFGLIVRSADGSILRTLPARQGGRWRSDAFSLWRWPDWTEPRWHARLKPVYDSLQALWRPQ